MKRTFAFATIVAAVCLLAGCQKEGKYNPKEKIANIYSEYGSSSEYFDGQQWQTDNQYSSGKQLSEVWTWDGKKLTQIDYPDDEYPETIRFSYDGSQLVEAVTDEQQIRFTYDGKLLSKAEVFYLYGGQPTLAMTYTFEHDGKKISRVTLSGMGMEPFNTNSKAQHSHLQKLLLANFWPQSTAAQRAIKKLQACASKDNQSITIDYTWDGDNVSKLQSQQQGFSVSVSFEYDDKNNPYQGFVLSGAGMSETGVEFCNRNNIVKETYTYMDGQEDTESYSYEYDGKWPTSCTYHYTYQSDDYRESSFTTTYYEYK